MVEDIVNNVFVFSLLTRKFPNGFSSSRSVKPVTMWLNCALYITFAGLLNASKVLVFFPVPNTSHFKVGEGISLALANAGHEVTMVTPYDYKTNMSNLAVEVITGSVTRHLKSKKGITLKKFESSGLTDLIHIMSINEKIVEYELTHPTVKKILDTGSFELVIMEMFAEQALLGMGPHFDAPIIAVSTSGASAWTNDLVGNPSPPSYVPHAFSSYPSRMNLLERMNNLLLDAAEKIIYLYYLYPGQVCFVLNHL